MIHLLSERIPDLPPAYLLAGGFSRRFGSDKARVLRYGAPSLIWLQKQMLEIGCPSVTVVARTPEAYVDLGIVAIKDNWPGLGPLAGLEAALSDAKSDRILLISCDLLEVRPNWIQLLVQASGGAVAFRDRFWHPFPGCYDRKLLAVLRSLLNDPGCNRSFQSLFSHSHVDSTALALPGDWPTFFSFNTLSEFHRGT